MEVVTSNWRHTPAIQLAAALPQEAGFRIDQQVNPAVTTSRIVTEPLETLESDLETLSAGTTPENLHSKIDYFEAVGKEAF